MINATLLPGTANIPTENDKSATSHTHQAHALQGSDAERCLRGNELGDGQEPLG